MESTRADLLDRGQPRIARLPPHSAGRRFQPAWIGIVVATACLAAQAQEGAVRSGWLLEPSLELQQTVTDNVRLSSTDRRYESITEVSPRLRVSSQAGPVRGFFDYSLSGIIYGRETSANTVQQLLNAAGTAEAFDRWAYIDASANISQQYVSSLGTQSPSPTLINSNRTEVASLRLSPYVRGPLGGVADYEARLSWEGTNTKNSNADSSSTEALLRVGSSASTFTKLGWSADYSRQIVHFDSTGNQDLERLNGVLTFAATPEVRLSARAGYEVNDLISLDRKGYKTWGGGATWTPTERTRLDALFEHRFFGSSHSFTFQHRMPRSVWSFTDTKDVSTSSSTQGANPSRTVFDLLFEQFASIAPDPIQRAALVDAFLRNNGLTRTTLATGGFLTSSTTIQRNQNFSVALIGLRSTVLISTFRTDARPVDPASGTGDFAGGRTLHQHGFGVNLSHRLTPLSALSVDFVQSDSNAGGDTQSTELRSLTATWSTNLRERVALSISARRALFDSATNPYAESAVIANLTFRF